MIKNKIVMNFWYFFLFLFLIITFLFSPEKILAGCCTVSHCGHFVGNTWVPHPCVSEPLCTGNAGCIQTSDGCYCHNPGDGGTQTGQNCKPPFVAVPSAPDWQCQSGGCLLPSYVVCAGGDPEDNCCRRPRTIGCQHMVCALPAPPPCTVTSPSGLTATSVDVDSATITWTPGTGGSSQRIYLDSNANKVANNCVAGCLVKVEGVGAALNSYATGGVLTDGISYTYKIVNYSSDSCSAANSSSFDHSFIKDPWFQVDGGSIHANSGGINSQVPSSCSGSCIPSLITQSVAGSTGLASFGSGAVNVGDGLINEDGSEWVAQTSFKDNQTGYDYFYRILGDDPEGAGEWDGSLPSVTFPETKKVFLADAGVTTNGGDWQVNADEQIILLADGDVVIDNNIDVVEGGFLAIISSGNIVFGDNVTNAEGVFIADGIISSGTGSNQLIGEGIFAGWSGMSLGRDLDVDNNTNPAELFVYRPDLQLNAYEYLQWLNLAWKEVAP